MKTSKKKIKKIAKPRTPGKIKKIKPRKVKAAPRKKLSSKTDKKIFGQPALASARSTLASDKPVLASARPVLAIKTKPIQKMPEISQPISIPEQISTPEIKSPLISQQRTKISRHVLDLKSVKKIEPAHVSPLKKKEEEIYRQIMGDFNSRKSNLGKDINNSWQGLKDSLASLAPKPKVKASKNILTQKKERVTSKSAAKAFNWPKLPKIEIQFGRFLAPAYALKALTAFILICIIIILPFSAYNYYQKLQGKKTEVFSQASQALWHLAIFQKAAAAKDLPNAQIQLEESAANFNQAKAKLDDINLVAKGLISLLPNVDKQYSAANNLIDAAAKLSSSAASLTDAIDQIKIKKSLDGLNLTSNLDILKSHLNLILPDLQTASDELAQVQASDLPAEYQDKFQMVKTALPEITANVKNFLSVSDLISKVFGQDSQKRYLVLFQNNNEIRPTGGFIGSYALVDIDRGNLKKISVPGGGPYDLKGAMTANIESPLPLHLVNSRWEFQDANWFANLPDSAEKLSYLLEKSNGPTVDGMIFINASMVQDLLAITGSIDLPQYQMTINSDNFIDKIQKEVEINYDKTANKPKQIIADLTPLLISKMLNSDQQQFLQLFDLFLTSLNSKEIQFYFSNYDLEQFVSNNGWAGRLKDTNGDYLDIVSTNIAGEKTDAKITQSAVLKVQVQPDGSIIDNLEITKTHTGLVNEAFYGVSNVDYLRVYVPEGSQLLSAEGFETIPAELFIDDNQALYQKDSDIASIESTRTIDPQTGTETLSEENKTVFANWMQVKPGQTQTVKLSYKLPFKIKPNFAPTDLNSLTNLKNLLHFASSENTDPQSYSLLWQKQSGKRNFVIHVEISLPQAYKFQTIYPQGMQKDAQTFTYTTELDTDKLLAIIFQQ